MPTVRLADGDLNYSLEGPAGAPVLLLSNSLGTDLGMWDTQIPALTAHFRVLRYDTRGHGASLVTPGPYAIGQLGADVLALLDALELPRVHFCGLSMGGLIGQWLGIHAGERLGRLVLCNTAAKIASDEVWNTRIDTVLKGGEQAMRDLRDASVARWFTAGFAEREPAQVERIVAKPPMDEKQRYEAGMQVRRAVLGDAHVERSLANLTPFNEEFQEMITRHAWGDIWTRPGLPRHTRSLVTIAMLIGMNRNEELKLHLRAAKNNGVSRDEIKEVIMQSAIYCGIPAANATFHLAESVWDELGVESQQASR